MSAFKIVIFIVLILVSLFFMWKLVAESRKKPNLNSLFNKLFACLSFVLLGFASFWCSNAATSVSILIMLVLSAAGSLFLEFKGLYPHDRELYLKLGLITFIVSEIFCFMFLFHQYTALVTGIWIGAVVGAIAFFIFFRKSNLLNLNFRNFKLIASVYEALRIYLVVYSAFVSFNDFKLSKFLVFIALLCLTYFDYNFVMANFRSAKKISWNGNFANIAFFVSQIIMGASLFFI